MFDQRCRYVKRLCDERGGAVADARAKRMEAQRGVSSYSSSTLFYVHINRFTSILSEVNHNNLERCEIKYMENITII